MNHGVTAPEPVRGETTNRKWYVG